MKSLDDNAIWIIFRPGHLSQKEDEDDIHPPTSRTSCLDSFSGSIAFARVKGEITKDETAHLDGASRNPSFEVERCHRKGFVLKGSV